MKRRTSELGSTLVEMMVTVAVMFLIIGGTLMFMISQAKMGTSAMDRNDIQRGGRSAMTLLSDKIGGAGLGLPRILAIKSFVSTNTEANACPSTPKLEVVSLEYRREWTAAGTIAGTISLASPDPAPGGSAADVVISSGRWLYLFTGAGAGANGMVRAGAVRAIGVNSVTVDSTNFSTAQTSLDMTATSALNNSSGHPLVMLQASVSGFGVDCTNAAHPYLYWDDNGTRTPVVSNVDTRPLTAANAGISAASTDVVALRFRFFIDQDGDGQPDSTTPGTGLAFNADPSLASNDDVIAVEVLIRVRGDRTDPQLDNQFRTQDFVQVIRTDNINTRAAQYVFVDNTGL
jgi:hypothetical protein